MPGNALCPPQRIAPPWAKPLHNKIGTSVFCFIENNVQLGKGGFQGWLAEGPSAIVA